MSKTQNAETFVTDLVVSARKISGWWWVERIFQGGHRRTVASMPTKRAAIAWAEKHATVAR